MQVLLTLLVGLQVGGGMGLQFDLPVGLLLVLLPPSAHNLLVVVGTLNLQTRACMQGVVVLMVLLLQCAPHLMEGLRVLLLQLRASNLLGVPPVAR